MSIHTTNFTDTFLSVSDDCPADHGQPPPEKAGVPSVAAMQYALVVKHPYRYTSDEVLFRVHADRNDIAGPERDAAREQFFSKGQPCFRASPLTKRYGFGVHFDREGKMALYGRESERYEALAADPELKQVKAMRNARK